MINEIIEFNKQFVARKGYEQYVTDKYPDKKLAVLSCMDTRLTELLPAALGLKNGDAKIIKNAGGLVISPFDSAMRSLVVAVYELGVQEIMVVAHSNCGACHMSYDHFHHEMIERGVTDETLDHHRLGNRCPRGNHVKVSWFHGREQNNHIPERRRGNQN